MLLTTGTHGAFQWLSTDTELEPFLRLCPDAVLGKCIAITSTDSGFLFLDEQLKSQGWESRQNIAYSPRIQSIDLLPHDGYDEWYVLEEPRDLGHAHDSNVFETPPAPGRVQVFVNYCGFSLDKLEHRSLADIFWKQLEFVNPESYLADGSDFLIFVTRNSALFRTVCDVLKNS